MNMLERVVAYASSRAGEASTIRGLAFMLSSSGLIAYPEQAVDIVAGAFFLVGLLGAALPDKNK
jgi:hypothetical protein